MKRDYIKYSLQSLSHRKLRSWLTILSILIGIAAIFTLVSFGLGLQNYIDSLAEDAGTDKLFLQAKGIGLPGTNDNFIITSKDINFVSKIKGVKEAFGMSVDVGEIKSNGETKYTFVSTWDTKYNDFVIHNFGIDLVKGRSLKESDVHKITVGYNYQLPNKIFSKPLGIGDKIELNGVNFEIVGIYSEVGNPQDDSNIYMTEPVFGNLFSKKDEYNLVFLQAEKNYPSAKLADKIEDKFRKYKNQEKGKEDFFVQTFEDALQTFNTIFNIINVVLILIVLISVVVASVNIMNTMYTAVLERTSEIGLMKAIGAKSNDIMFIFIFESGFLGLVGGVLGVLFGYVISYAGGVVAAQAGYSLLQPIFPWYLIVGCLLFAFLVGAGSGYLPAKQASQLQAVEALRYE